MEGTRIFAKFNDLNEDTLLFITTLLDNQGLLCLALTFSACFKLSNSRYYWKKLPRDFHFERLAGWEEYTGKEIRRASLRAYRSFQNWASDDPKVKSHTHWKEHTHLYSLPLSRWVIRWHQKSGKASFLDLMQKRSTEFKKIPHWEGSAHILSASAPAPNQILFGFQERETIFWYQAMIRHKWPNRLEATVSLLSSFEIPFHSRKFTIYQPSNDHVTVSALPEESKSGESELFAFNIRTSTMHSWQTNLDIVCTCTRDDLLFVVTKSKWPDISVDLAIIDLAKLHSASKEELKDLKLVTLQNDVHPLGEVDAGITGRDDTCIICLNINKPDQYNESFIYSVVFEPSNGIHCHVRVRPWKLFATYRFPPPVCATTYENKDALYSATWAPTSSYRWRSTLGPSPRNTDAFFYKLDREGGQTEIPLQMPKAYEILKSISEHHPYALVPSVEPEMIFGYLSVLRAYEPTRCLLYRF